jgi:nitrite reductase (NADH) large subunit
MPPLRPISVPPGRISGLSSRRVPSSISPASPASLRTRTGLLVSAAASLGISALVALAPPLPPARSFRGVHADLLWTERAFQEASGYAVVLLTLLGLALSARKRWKRFAYGDVAGLRVLHGALGAAALVCLGCHTGLHAGQRFNRLLTFDFLAASALGAVAAVATALGDPVAGAARRLLATRAHLFILLPLPVLVALHVLGAYYF